MKAQIPEKLADYYLGLQALLVYDEAYLSLENRPYLIEGQRRQAAAVRSMIAEWVGCHRPDINPTDLERYLIREAGRLYRAVRNSPAEDEAHRQLLVQGLEILITRASLDNYRL